MEREGLTEGKKCITSEIIMHCLSHAEQNACVDSEEIFKEKSAKRKKLKLVKKFSTNFSCNIFSKFVHLFYKHSL